jgi:hypothetical protein
MGRGRLRSAAEEIHEPADLIRSHLDVRTLAKTLHAEIVDGPTGIVGLLLLLQEVQ